MSQESYQAYLMSEHWHRMRQTVFQRDGFHCRVCGSTERLEGHHLSYCDLDDPKNVITLCHRCHRDLHEFWPEVRKSMSDGELKEAAKNYTETLARILDKYVIRREKTLSDSGDTTFLVEGRFGLMNKYIEFMFNAHPYYEPKDAWLRPYNQCGIGAMRYQKMRLARKETVKKRAARKERQHVGH